MDKDLDCINNWAIQWLVSINATTKTIFMLCTTKRPKRMPPLKLGTLTLHQVFSHKHLGLVVSKGSGSCLNQIYRYANENDTKSIVSIIEPQNMGPLEPLFDLDM